LSKKNNRHVRVGISTGDYDSNDPWLGRFDIIISTNEKVDSLLRHRTSWIDEVSLVVADEVHLINDADRGPTLEVVLARLMQINPKAQLLALSATVKNAEEVAEWLKASAVTNDWRPVMLREGVILHDEAHFKDGGALRVEKENEIPEINFASHVIKSGGQILIFASTRRSAVGIAKSMSSMVRFSLPNSIKRSLTRIANDILITGEKTRVSELLARLVKDGTAFHHAGLSGSHRRVIEKAFRNGKIKVLTATPTLAFGVNLPARMVVIRDYRRYEPGYGYYPISVLEYKQMAGRAGRPRYDKVGEALLIAKSEDEQNFLLESYSLADPERIWSKLGVERILRSHVLSTVASNFAHTEGGIYNFFSKTFYAYQYNSNELQNVISDILKFLYKNKMIQVNSSNIYATKFGRRVSELYIDPVSAITIREALDRRATELSDVSFLHMIAHTPDMVPKLRPYQRELDSFLVFVDERRDEFMFDVPNEWTDRINYEEFLGEVKLAWVLKSWIEETTEDTIIERFRVQPGDLYRLTETARWLLYASDELAVLLGHKDLHPPLTNLTERIKRGVKEELLQLVKLDGVGRVRARILYNSGFKTLKDLKQAPLERLTNLPFIGPRLTKRIKEQVGGFLRIEDWKKMTEDDWEQKALTEYE
jgi:helicase